QMEDPIQLPPEGNKYFQASDYPPPVQSYTQAIKLTPPKALQAVLYRNSPPCFLKDFQEPPPDAWFWITFPATPPNASDIKALYRRPPALEKLGKLDQAPPHAQKCATIEPRNKNFQETLRRLGANPPEKVNAGGALRIQFSTAPPVQKMFEILLDDPPEKEKREKAANNLIVLGREEAGAERIFQNNGVSLPPQLIETKNAELIPPPVRTLSGMCTGHPPRATAILHYLAPPNICMWMSVDNDPPSLAVCNLLQTIPPRLLGQGKEEQHAPPEAVVLDTKKDLRMITMRLLDMLVSKKVSGQGRDRALNLLNKNIPRKDLKDHDNSRTIFVIDNGLKKILKVVGQIPEMPDCLPLTENTQLTASVLLNPPHDDLRCDPERDTPPVICEEYIKSKIDPQDPPKTLHAIQIVSGPPQGPFDLGNKLLAPPGVMEMMVALCGPPREIDQLVAVEAPPHASTKLSRATFTPPNGVTLLKEIYNPPKNEKIKIRALGPPKLGSAGGTDYGLRQFAEGSTEKLATPPRKWLCNTPPDARTRKWAVEGLAYLTLDADVKDDPPQDEPALQAMFESPPASPPPILYSVASALVTPPNSYDTKELVPDPPQLAKFSKQHVPPPHPKKDFVVKRVNPPLKAGVVSALACPPQADSAILTDQSTPPIARVFLALCEDPKDRGTIVAQGGGKALIPLAVEGTEVGKIKASHALAKIAAISNPDMAFPGERVYEVVSPPVSLLNTERDGLPPHEALLGLTNFSAPPDKLRMKIVKAPPLPDIENYMFENPPQLRQAATECMCPPLVNKEVQERFVADAPPRLKLVVLLCGDPPEKVQVAAAGALPPLTASQKKLCSKTPPVTTQWLPPLQRLCLHDNMEAPPRGLVIAFNLISPPKELAKKLVETEPPQILTYIGKQEDAPPKQHIINVARDCLTRCMDYGLIKPL
ncbi:UN45B protein, partial [Nyctiprogne leucopyga]|nr:UN45B protein [Nyctiprogne leucopyga]